MRIVARNNFSEPEQLRLLEAACVSWDRAQEARLRVAKEGIITQTGTGSTKANPAVNIERESLGEFRKCLKQLRL